MPDRFFLFPSVFVQKKACRVCLVWVVDLVFCDFCELPLFCCADSCCRGGLCCWYCCLNYVSGGDAGAGGGSPTAAAFVAEAIWVLVGFSGNFSIFLLRVETSDCKAVSLADISFTISGMLTHVIHSVVMRFSCKLRVSQSSKLVGVWFV